MKESEGRLTGGLCWVCCDDNGSMRCDYSPMIDP